ncbi:gas vesicle protein [Streptomyces sp. NPDC046324]|uniref:gas vesicle protein GvpO n=1 Tax=Streptomyces sp. NPDC046324 TaxID=3154915 RepID=UPI0033D73389
MNATDDEQNKTSGQRIDISTAMGRASAQLSELLRCEPGSVSAVKATDDGWSADVEIVELEKIPDTMSVMASYHVALDPEGRLVAYERTRRYARGQIDRR